MNFEELEAINIIQEGGDHIIAKLKVHLINLLDQTMPGITKILELKKGMLKSVHDCSLLSGLNLLTKSS